MSQKKQTDIAKDQYKLFKDLINVINNNKKDGFKREDGDKTEDGAKIKDGKIIHEVNYFFIGDEYKNLVGKIFKVESMDGDLQKF